MNGKVIAIAGDLGAGKSTLVKKYSSLCKKKKVVCYLRIESDWEDNKIKKFTNFEEFLIYANKQTDTLFIIDEAFTCLPKKINVKMNNPKNIHNRLADFLVNCRKLNNFIFIIFHSLSQIPTEWLIPYLDYLIRYKTNDLLQYQIQRFKSFANIVKNLMEVQTVEDFKPITLKLR
jgi:archaellum biogenesis ATPase FlaH